MLAAVATGIRDERVGHDAPRPSEASTRFLGKVIAGRFRIDRVISEGGMGVVCQATQVPLNRRVALKLLSPLLRSSREEFSRRFHLEAATLARLIHPNVVTIHDYGQTEDGDLFLTMEYLAGRPLAEVIDEEGPLSWARILQIAIQICRGLREAHAVGVVHRDLKPANIMILPGDDDSLDHVKILDFGLVKLLNPEETPQTDLANRPDPREVTSRTYLQGSPRYMSPEQIVGAPIDLRTDIYSLGAVLFTMTAGVPPFDGATTVDIIHQHVNASVPPISEMGYRRECPPQLEEIIVRCLEKDPDRRYATVNDVLVHLKGVLHRVCGLQPIIRGNSITDLPGFVAPRAGSQSSAPARSVNITQTPLPRPIPPTPPPRAPLFTPTGPIEGIDIVAVSENVPARPPLSPPPDLKAALSGPTELFGQYKLLGMIAQGGMGRLYLAEKSGSPRLMALKRVLPHLSDDPELKRMFLTEAKVAAFLEHPNIVSTYEFGEVQGQPFIAMEYLAGEDLAGILDAVAHSERGRMPVDFATQVARNCARGLHYAHEMLGVDGHPAGVVHRDVNPSNIFVGYDGQVKLLDFGIAKVRAREATRAGTFKGKLGYSSPEQLSGAPVDRRTDIFCLGIVLWECLTGTQLFEGDSDASKVEAVRAKRIWPPSALRPHVPRELDEIVLKALARNPDERYASAEEMALALEASLHHQETSTQDLIGSWLEDLFPPDRVATKLALASGGHGALLATFKAPEAAGPISKPHEQTILDSSVSSVRPLATDTVFNGEGRSRNPTYLGLALVVLSLGAGGAWLVLGNRSSEPTSPPLAVVQTSAIEVRSEPPGAMIFVDGEPTGMLTPNVVRNVAVGKNVTIKVTKSGFFPEERAALAAANSAEAVNFTLKASYGTVRFTGVPKDARIYVDDQLVNNSNPLELPLGEHQLRVETATELVTSRTIKVAVGEQTEAIKATR
jgi:serine/threonine protein kinase